MVLLSAPKMKASPSSIALFPAEFGPNRNVSLPSGMVVGLSKTWKPPSVTLVMNDFLSSLNLGCFWDIGRRLGSLAFRMKNVLNILQHPVDQGTQLPSCFLRDSG
ncbi:MAG: hypothetical protein V5B32_13795 [Candidatus Accumulibacter sp. UW26]|jgi:hypothetical protein